MEKVTREYEVYLYNELKEDVQDKVYQKWTQERIEFGNPFDSENEKSLEMFSKIFDFKVTNWSYDEYNFDFSLYVEDFDDHSYEIDEAIRQMTGVRLAKYLWNNYVEPYLMQGKYYSTQGQWIDGKYHYKKRNSKVMFDYTCPLTGYYMDDVLIEPVLEFINKPNDVHTYEDIMKKCVRQYFKAVVSEYNHMFSKEYFEENEAYDNRYLVDGTYFDSEGVGTNEQ